MENFNMKNYFLFCALLLVANSLFGQLPVPHHNFPMGTRDVHKTLRHQGYLYVAGDGKVTYPVPFGAQISTSSYLPDFNLVRPNGNVTASISDGNGGWYIAGTFTEIVIDSTTRVPRKYLARILPNGTLDMNWDLNLNGFIYSMALNNNNLYVSGSFTSIGGIPKNYLAKVSAITGIVDVNWSPNVIINNQGANAMSVLNNYLYVAIDFGKIRKIDLVGVGAVDPSFNITCYDVNVMKNYGNQLIVAGAFNQIGSVIQARIAKVNTTGPLAGTVDASWLPNFSGPIYDMEVYNDTIFVGGDYTSVNSVNMRSIAKLRADGSGVLFPTWNPGLNSTGIAQVHSLKLINDTLYIGGIYSTINGADLHNLGRVKATGNGEVDSNWHPRPHKRISTISSFADKLFIGGYFESIGGSKGRVSRIRSNGTIDEEWNPNPNGYVNDLIIVDSYLYLGGLFGTIGGHTIQSLARVDTQGTGAVDASWNPQCNGSIKAIAQTGNELTVGGDFTSIGGLARANIAKISTGTTATVDPTSWTNGSNNIVHALKAVNNDLYIGGSFTNIGNYVRYYVAKANATTGVIDPLWVSGTNGLVRAFAIKDSSIFLGGDFNGIRRSLSKRNRFTAALDTAWQADFQFGSEVHTLDTIGDRLIAGGDFETSIPNQHNLAMYDMTTGANFSIWKPYTPYNSSTSTQFVVNTVNVSEGEIFIGGNFRYPPDVIHSYLQKYNTSPLCFPATSQLIDSICAGSTYSFGGQLLTTAGTYKDTLLNSSSFGCDSIITLQLLVKNQSSNTLNLSTCDSITVNGQFYNTSGTYNQTLVNSTGCDSNLTINLTINNSSSNTITQTSCDPITINGQTYSTTGTYFQTLTNAQGCDSNLTLNLTINSVAAGATMNGLVLSASPSGASYRWIKCNPYSLISGALNQTYSATSNGDYAVIVTLNGCSDTSNCLTINNVGLEDYQNNKISIFPNPTDNKAHVELDKVVKEFTVEVLSMSGRVLIHKTARHSSTLNIDLGSISSGIYFIKVRTPEWSGLQKIEKL